MPIYLKHGIFPIKKYNIYPDKTLCLKTGKYTLDVHEDCIKSKNLDLHLDVGLLQFYIDLDIDFSRDSEVKIFIDKEGNIKREDRIEGISSIETLFSCCE